MMKFEWLLPENAVKLLLAIMLFQSEVNFNAQFTLIICMFSVGLRDR